MTSSTALYGPPLSWATLACLLATPNVLAQAAGFGSQTIISTAADRPTDIFAADLDGDGNLDVLSTSLNDDKVAWYQNLGGGVFGPQQIITTAANGAKSVFAADLDGDGDADTLTASSTDDTVAWHENLGGGTFGARQIISTAADSVSSVFAIDLDSDGDADVLSASSSDDKLAWYQNLGNGTFGPQQIITTAADAVSQVHAADLDGDGDADVLSTSLVDREVAWNENLGGGSFGPLQVIATGATIFTSVETDDLDGDGDADVLITGGPSDVSWLENLGAGNFGPQQLISNEIAGCRNASTGDFDGDGDRDVVAIGAAAFNQLGWFENLGGGSFGPLQAIEIGNSPLITGGAVALAADVDGDGVDDVLAAANLNDAIAWYRNFPDTTTFGEGCGSARLTFAPTSEAVVNTPITASVTHSPTTLCVVTLGLSRTTMPGLGALPFDLGALGMAGCTLYQSADVFGLATQPSSVPFLGIAWTGGGLPANAVGLHLYAQAVAFAPNANALGVLSSNAIDWTITQ